MPKKRSFKHMRSVALQLPEQFQEGALVVSGADIIKARGEDAKEVNGNPIDPDKPYRIAIYQRVNHYRRIKKLFNAKGYDAVREYIDNVIALYAESLVQHQQFMNTLPVQPMSI